MFPYSGGRTMQSRSIALPLQLARGAVFLLACLPASAQFPSKITRVVVIVQENRTPDNLFHYLTPACPIPKDAKGLSACTPSPVTDSCYNISPCGLSNQKGSPVRETLKSISLSSTVNPDHSHKSFEQMCDLDTSTFQCRIDGAWRLSGSNDSYTYVSNASVTNSNGSKGHILDPYMTLVKQYGWANYMYQTNQGPSYTAHQFIFSGTSALSSTDDANSIFIAENPISSLQKESGCLAPAGAANDLIEPVMGQPTPGCTLYGNKSVEECPITNTALDYPVNPVGTFCTSHQSMADVLDAPAISWKYYATTPGYIWTAPVSIQSICQPAFVNPNGDPSSSLKCTGSEWTANVDTNNLGTDILRDVTNCNLANVSWITPDGVWSDHAGSYGPSWVAAIINAIGNNPTCPQGTTDAGQNYWQNTAILVTWDDWGGWSDHEQPLLAGALPCTSANCPAAYQYGFRVPLLVVSAYTPAGLIDNIPHDFGSILRMIEGVNNLPEGELGFADARSTSDLSNFFTLSTPRGFTTIPAEKNANFFLTYKGAAVEPDDD
jgi:phospholipase C